VVLVDPYVFLRRESFVTTENVADEIRLSLDPS